MLFFFQTRDAQLYNIFLRSAIYFYTNIMSTLAIYGDMLDMFPIKKSLFKGQIGAICYIRVKFSARYFVWNVSEYPSSVLDIHAL